MLHISNNGLANLGKRHNIGQDVLDILIRNFQDPSAPRRNLSVDVMMVGFPGGPGHCAPKQYMPT